MRRVKEARRMRAFMIYALAALWLALSGCKQQAVETVPSVPQNTIGAEGTALEPPPSARPIVLGFSQLGSESAWRLANTNSIQEAAAEAGVVLMYENAEQSQSKQFDAIRSFIRQKVDVIAIAPVVQTGWEPILKEAKEAGIPVIICDRSIEVEDSSLYVTLIGSDFYEEGRKAGKYLLDRTRDSVGPIGIAELKGTEGSTPSIERGQGFRETIAGRGDFKFVASEFADFTFDGGKKTMRKFLSEKGDEINVLYAHNDDMALGAIEAIEEYGLKPGKDIVIISVDGTRRALEQLAQGKISLVVECNPLLGPDLMQAATEIIQGRTLTKRIVPTESVFTEQMAKREALHRKY